MRRTVVRPAFGAQPEPASSIPYGRRPEALRERMPYSSAALAARPPLTTIRQPWQRVSSEMVRLLLAAISGQEPSAVILPTELVRRGSA